MDTHVYVSHGFIIHDGKTVVNYKFDELTTD